MIRGPLPRPSFVQNIYLSETRLRSYLPCALPETAFQPVNSPLCQVLRRTPLLPSLFRIILMIVFYAEFVKSIYIFGQWKQMFINHSSSSFKYRHVISRQDMNHNSSAYLTPKVLKAGTDTQLSGLSDIYYFLLA